MNVTVPFPKCLMMHFTMKKGCAILSTMIRGRILFGTHRFVSRGFGGKIAISSFVPGKDRNYFTKCCALSVAKLKILIVFKPNKVRLCLLFTPMTTYSVASFQAMT